MEAAEKDKITRLLPTLIEQIDCNVVLISELKAANAIVHGDECHLSTFANKLYRSNELLTIMCTRKDGYKLLVNALRKTRQTGALETLQESSHFEPTHHEVNGVSISQFGQMQISETTSNVSGLAPFKKIPFHTREAIELFTGRRKELDMLLESLLPDGGTASIIGIGGVGKTELAKMFLQTLDEEAYENIFKQIIWINCESAQKDFTDIARDYLEVPVLGSSNQRRDISSILNDVYDKLQKSKSLVVLDNVETREILQKFMPKRFSKQSKLSILITSQNSVLKIGTHISLDCLDLTEAVEFVKKGLDSSVSMSKEFENGISELVLRLEMFPLAVSQAIGYIKVKTEMNPNYRPQDYLVDLDRIPQSLLDGDFFTDISSQGKTTYKTLVLALEKIEACPPFGLLATNILSKVAFMAPHSIPLRFFSELAPNNLDAVEGAIILMRRFFLITYTPVGESNEVFFSMHRLVQDVFRIRIDQLRVTTGVVYSIMTMFSLNIDSDLIHHALETWEHAKKILFLVEVFPNFPSGLANKMVHVGLFTDAADFATSSLLVLKENLCEEKYASSILWLQAVRGLCLGEQGKFEESIETLDATLNGAKNYLHPDHSIIFKLHYFTALICFQHGQNEKAALLCDNLYKKVISADNDSLRPLLDIASLQMCLKRFKAALETVSKILSYRFVSEHPETATFEHDTRMLLASIHCRMGKYSECINLFTELLHTHLKKPKSKGFNYASWQLFFGLGTCQVLAGRFEEAHDSLQKALNETSGQKEKDCIWILTTKGNIAALMLVRNMVDEALPFAIEVHERIKKLVDEKHVMFLHSLGNIGVAYSKTGRHQDAVAILTQVVENQSFVAQCDDEACFEKFHLAISLEELGNFEKATLMFNESRRICLELPNYKPVTLDQVETAFKRLENKVRIVDK